MRYRLSRVSGGVKLISFAYCHLPLCHPLNHSDNVIVFKSLFKSDSEPFTFKRFNFFSVRLL